MHSPKPFRQILSAFIPLRRVREHARQMRSLHQIVIRYLPPDCANHVHYVHLDDTTLVLYVDSPEWSSRLRFLLPDVKSSLKLYHNYQYINELQVRNISPTPLPVYSSKFSAEKPTIMKETIDSIEQLSEKKSPALQQSLRRLALTLRQKYLK